VSHIRRKPIHFLLGSPRTRTETWKRCMTRDVATRKIPRRRAVPPKAKAQIGSNLGCSIEHVPRSVLTTSEHKSWHETSRRTGNILGSTSPLVNRPHEPTALNLHAQMTSAWLRSTGHDVTASDTYHAVGNWEPGLSVPRHVLRDRLFAFRKFVNFGMALNDLVLEIHVSSPPQLGS
jgi:hypothetical protein